MQRGREADLVWTGMIGCLSCEYRPSLRPGSPRLSGECSVESSETWGSLQLKEASRLQEESAACFLPHHSSVRFHQALLPWKMNGLFLSLFSFI